MIAFYSTILTNIFLRAMTLCWKSRYLELKVAISLPTAFDACYLRLCDCFDWFALGRHLFHHLVSCSWYLLQNTPVMGYVIVGDLHRRLLLQQFALQWADGTFGKVILLLWVYWRYWLIFEEHESAVVCTECRIVIIGVLLFYIWANLSFNNAFDCCIGAFHICQRLSWHVAARFNLAAPFKRILARSTINHALSILYCSGVSESVYLLILDWIDLIICGN